MTAGGVATDDGELPNDAIVCATGFKVALPAGFRGSSTRPAGRWTRNRGDGGKLYRGVSAPRLRNYYAIVGSGAMRSRGALLPSIETTVEYAVKVMGKIRHENIGSVDVYH